MYIRTYESLRYLKLLYKTEESKYKEEMASQRRVQGMTRLARVGNGQVNLHGDSYSKKILRKKKCYLKQMVVDKSEKVTTVNIEYFKRVKNRTLKGLTYVRMYVCTHKTER